MTAEEKMVRITDGLPTISAKIRALNAEGFRRSEIARFLHRQPTHVRNVLKAEEYRRGPAPVPGAGAVRPTPTSQAASEMEDSACEGGWAQIDHLMNTRFRLEIDPEGRLTLPPQALDLLNARKTPVVMGSIENGEFVLISVKESVRRVQQWAQKTFPPDVDLAAELIAQRRREAEAEAG